jgi:DNA-binding transcriptional LysR family regulator
MPTRAALTAVQRATDLQARLRALGRLPHDAATWAPDADTAILRVGMAPAAALLYGPRVERRWRELQPDGLLRITSGSSYELLAALHAHELDLAIAPQPRGFQSRGTRRMHLHTSTPCVYGCRGHPRAAATSLAAIGDAGWAVAGRAGTAGNVIEEALRVRKLPAPRILAQCADYMTLQNLVAQSELLCVIPHPALLQETAEGRIVAFELREGLPQYEVCLFWLEDNASASEGIAAIVHELRGAAHRD